MNVILYVNSSDSKKLNKTITQVSTLDVNVKDTMDVVNPVLILGANVPNIYQINYVYIPDFHRYYFAKVTTEPGGRMIITCHVDVLMSNKDTLLNTKAIVKRSSNNNNAYLVDNELQRLNYSQYEIKSFPNSFNTTLDFVLAVCGG